LPDILDIQLKRNQETSNDFSVKFAYEMVQ